MKKNKVRKIKSLFKVAPMFKVAPVDGTRIDDQHFVI